MEESVSEELKEEEEVGIGLDLDSRCLSFDKEEEEVLDSFLIRLLIELFEDCVGFEGVRVEEEEEEVEDEVVGIELG